MLLSPADAAAWALARCDHQMPVGRSALLTYQEGIWSATEMKEKTTAAMRRWHRGGSSSGAGWYSARLGLQLPVSVSTPPRVEATAHAPPKDKKTKVLRRIRVETNLNHQHCRKR